jgi:chromosome partitioning protein
VIVVAVYNMKGGVGKSTAAVNLAYLSAATGARTLLWDLDAQAASSFAFRVHPRVEGFGKKSLRQIDTLTEAIKATDYDNLDLLPADFAYRHLDRFLQDQPDRDLAAVLQKLGRGYSHVLLDCPPGLSTLSESVFDAADLVLVPTIPTVLSLRTLARLVEHFGHHGEVTKVAAFLSMVDKRKSLHRDISEFALRQPELFLAAQVPYASIVEQTSVRRMPLAVVARQDPVTTVFDALWSGVRAKLAEPAPTTTPERRRSAAFAKAIGDVIARVGGEHEPDAVNAEHAAVSAATAADSRICTHRIKVHDAQIFDSLFLELSADAPPPATLRLAHIFDTDEGVLHRNGYLLQVLEDSGRFAVTLEVGCNSAEPLSQREEKQVAAIDGHWAADILAGSLSPITVLERRLGRPLPPVVSEVIAAIGKKPLRRVSWRKRLRRRLGPVNVPFEEAVVALHFEFDRISSPGNTVDHEIEASAPASSAHNIERALRQFLSHTGISWQPVMVQVNGTASNGAAGEGGTLSQVESLSELDGTLIATTELRQEQALSRSEQRSH